MSHPQLSAGAIEAMHRNETENPVAKNALVQILAVKSITTSNPPRWRYVTRANTRVACNLVTFGIQTTPEMRKCPNQRSKIVLTRSRIILSDGKNYLQSTLLIRNANAGLSIVCKPSQRFVFFGKDSSKCYHSSYAMGPKSNQGSTVCIFVVKGTNAFSVVIILSLDLVTSEVKTRIGSPVPVETVSQPAQAPIVQQPQPAMANHQFARPNAASGPAAPAGMDSHGQVVPIGSLNPYQNKWTICARATNKSEIKTWSNDKGEGRLFNVVFADESGEIRCTAFKEAVTAFYDLIQEGQIYYVSKAKIGIARGKFGGVQHNYELTLEPNTQITPCHDRSIKAPVVTYNFVKLSELYNAEKDNTVDIIGVVKDVGDLQSITSKATQKPLDKRDVTLVDETKWACRLTLWGKNAVQFDGSNHPIMAIKSAKVGDYGGRSLSMYSTSTMTLNPDIPEAHRLRGWFDGEGQTTEYNQYSGGQAQGQGKQREDNNKTVAQIRDENLGCGEKPDYFNLKGTIAFIRNENFCYPACSTEGCNRKVVEEGDGWRCEKCSKTFPQPKYRYILSVAVSDHTGQTWVTAFDEHASQLVGASANEMMDMKV
jgi:replication factor A1